jgi:hypothetical protein
MATHTSTATINGSTVNIVVTIPEMSDAANIQKALNDFADSIMTNISPYLVNQNKVVVSESGSPAVIGSTGRVFLQATEPTNKAIGDVWMW